MNSVSLPLYGLSCNTDKNVATQQAKVFYYLLDSYGQQAALTYLDSVGFLKIVITKLTNLVPSKVPEAREAIKAI